MIINTTKLDDIGRDQVVLWLRANGCDYHTPRDGKIIVRGGWIETEVIEKFSREQAIKFDASGPIVTGTKRFRQRFPLSAFRKEAEALNAWTVEVNRSTRRKRVPAETIDSPSGLARLFAMAGGVIR